MWLGPVSRRSEMLMVSMVLAGGYGRPHVLPVSVPPAGFEQSQVQSVQVPLAGHGQPQVSTIGTLFPGDATRGPRHPRHRAKPTRLGRVIGPCTQLGPHTHHPLGIRNLGRAFEVLPCLFEVGANLKMKGQN